VRGDDWRAQFVTVEAYAAAGGGVITDLFRKEGEGYLTDPALLALCAEFTAIDAIFWRHDDRFSDDEMADLGQKWDALVPRITAISAKTDQGRKAKAEVAYLVMRTAEAGEFQARKDLVRSALADVVGGNGT
jgi:hypothetical protein